MNRDLARSASDLRADISGWRTRIGAADIERYTASGAWRNVTLADCAQRIGQRAPARIAVSEGERTASFGQILVQAHRLAAALRAAGLQPGEVVSFQLPNWTETMVINLAACIAGLVVNPIVPIYRDAEVRHILCDARSRMLFVPRGFRGFDYAQMAQRLRPALPMLREVVVVRGEPPGPDPGGWTTWTALLTGAPASEPAVIRADPNAVKLLLYTSGTTGSAKGVLHSHNTIMSEIDAVIAFWGITERDVVLMPSPVTHITGYLYALEIAFAAGVQVVLMERWDAARAVDLIERHNVTFSVGATPFLKELVAEVEARPEFGAQGEVGTQRAALPSLRLFMSGGAPVPPELILRANQVLPGCLAFRVYGSSEAPTVTLGIRSRAEARLGAYSDGRIVNHEVRLTDPTSGATVAGEGEICTRGPEVMLGYTDWEQTQASFDAQGYFRTGDLGHLVDGEYLCVTGRKKDLIIRGGENISPKEIEDVLHTHPAVKEAAVIAMPHPRLGEGVCAFIVAHPGHGFDVAAAAAWLEQAGLAKQKFPERVELVEDLPRTASGKVQKNVLRERIAARLAR